MATDNRPQPPKLPGARVPEHDDINDDDYDNDIPLQHMRPFGSGLHKRFISFVPAAEATGISPGPSKQHEQGNKSVSEMYLNLVSSSNSSATADKSPPSNTVNEEKDLNAEPQMQTCQVCQRSIPTSEMKAHEASIPHQSRLEHSHPPSALDRTRMGLAILSSHGWDPDAREGLGASHQGIQHPLKTKPKDDKLGIGTKVPKNLPPGSSKKMEKTGKPLGAGQVRKLIKEEKRKTEKIRRQLLGNDKLDRYLETGSVASENKLDWYLAKGSAS